MHDKVVGLIDRLAGFVNHRPVPAAAAAAAATDVRMLPAGLDRPARERLKTLRLQITDRLRDCARECPNAQRVCCRRGTGGNSSSANGDQTGCVCVCRQVWPA